MPKFNTGGLLIPLDVLCAIVREPDRIEVLCQQWYSAREEGQIRMEEANRCLREAMEERDRYETARKDLEAEKLVLLDLKKREEEQLRGIETKRLAQLEVIKEQNAQMDERCRALDNHSSELDRQALENARYADELRQQRYELDEERHALEEARRRLAADEEKLNKRIKNFNDLLKGSV